MEILNELRKHIVMTMMKDTSEKKLDDDCPLILEGILDSMGIVSLLGFIEKRFSIRIDNDELVPENFETLLAISKLIESKLLVGKGA